MRTRFIDSHTIEEVDTVGGKLRTPRTGAISKDGKVLTVAAKGTNAEGQATNSVTVYENR